MNKYQKALKNIRIGLIFDATPQMLEKELNDIINDRQAISKEKERIFAQAKQEVKKIVIDKLAEAEEIVDELKTILKTSNLSNKDTSHRLKDSHKQDTH